MATDLLVNGLVISQSTQHHVCFEVAVIVGLLRGRLPMGHHGHCFGLGLLAHGTDEAEALAGLDQTPLRTGAADRASGRVDWRCQC
jgi:hypothetical protein